MYFVFERRTEERRSHLVSCAVAVFLGQLHGEGDEESIEREREREREIPTAPSTCSEGIGTSKPTPKHLLKRNLEPYTGMVFACFCFSDMFWMNHNMSHIEAALQVALHQQLAARSCRQGLTCKWCVCVCGAGKTWEDLRLTRRIHMNYPNGTIIAGDIFQ